MDNIQPPAFFANYLSFCYLLQPSLSPTAAETLIHDFVTSRLHYCNSLLFGATNKVLHKLLYVQNSAAYLPVPA